MLLSINNMPELQAILRSAHQSLNIQRASLQAARGWVSEWNKNPTGMNALGCYQTRGWWLNQCKSRKAQLRCQCEYVEEILDSIKRLRKLQQENSPFTTCSLARRT